MSSYDLLAAVTSQVSRFEPFRKFSKDAKESFAFDITLVALSIRCAFKFNVDFEFFHWVLDAEQVIF